MILHHMTWPECRTISWARTLAVLPLGATEQHGPHLPCDTDTLLVTAIAERVEKTLPDRLLLCPTLWLGHSTHHQAFGATLSTHHGVYTALLAETIASLRRMGCEKLLLLNGHGGNRVPAMAALQESKDQHPDFTVLLADYWSLAADDILRIVTGGDDGMGHAGELETSLYMALRPEGVRRSELRDAGRGNCPAGPAYQGYMLRSTPVAWVDDFTQITDTGAFGKPTLATPEKGEALFAAIVMAVRKLAEAILVK